MSEKLLALTTENLTEFWGKFGGYISFLEDSVRLGHNEEFKVKYQNVNKVAQKFHPDLRVEFGLDMMEAQVTSIVVTSAEKGEGRKIANTVAAARPDSLGELVTPYRLPVLMWDTTVTTNWLSDLCAQYGYQSVSTEMGHCLANMKVGVKVNPNSGKVIMQFGFKNKHEKKAIDKEIVELMLEMLLGEQIAIEAIESKVYKVARDVNDGNGWHIVNGIQCRDTILKLLM